MQLAEDLGPVHDVSEARSGSHRYDMLVLLHGLLLSLAVSEGRIHAYRVSQVKGKITKLFSWILSEAIAQLIKCNCSVQLLQLLIINSAVISIEEAKEPRVPLASDTA